MKFKKIEIIKSLPFNFIFGNIIASLISSIFFIFVAVTTIFTNYISDTPSVFIYISSIIPVLISIIFLKNIITIFLDVFINDIEKYSCKIEFPPIFNIEKHGNSFPCFFKDIKKKKGVCFSAKDTNLLLKKKAVNISYYGLRKTRQIIKLTSIDNSPVSMKNENADIKYIKRYFTLPYFFAFFEPIIFLGVMLFFFESKVEISNITISFIFLAYAIFVYIRAYIGYKTMFSDTNDLSFFKFFLLFRKICFVLGISGEIPADVIERTGEDKAKKSFYKIVPMCLIAIVNIFTVLVWILEIKKLF